MENKSKPSTSGVNNGLTITIGSKRIAEKAAAAAAAAAAKAESEESLASASTNGAKKRPPPPLPVTKSTRPTRAVKNARKIYSPPTTPVPSPSSNKRNTRPSNRVKAPPPVVVSKAGKEMMIKSNKEYFRQALSTIEGQTKLIQRADKDEKFGQILINSLNQHVSKVVENVRAKRTKNKGKMTKSMQLAEMKNSKRVDLNSPESILTSINLSSVINRQNFDKLPSFYQYKLTKLLPKCDQISMTNGVLAPSTSAFNNEFFSRALASFSYRLTEGRLTFETLARLKRETEREKKNLDPFKVKYFEPFFKDPEVTSDSLEKESQNNLKYISIMSKFYNGVRLYFEKDKNSRPSVHFDKNVIRSSGKKQKIEQLNDTIPKSFSATTSTASGKSAERTTRQSDFPLLVIAREKKSDLQIEELDCFEQASFDAYTQMDTSVPVAEEKMEITDSQDICSVSNEPVFDVSNFFQVNNPNLELLQAQQQLTALPQSSATNIKFSQPPTACASTSNVIPIFPVAPLPQPKTTKVAKPRAPRKPKATAAKKDINTIQPFADGQPQIIRFPFSPSKMDMFLSFEKQLTPQLIIRHLPSTSKLNSGLVDWNNYTQSMYFIKCYLQRFLEQLQLNRNDFNKLQHITRVLFSPLKILCDACVKFLNELLKYEMHKSWPVILSNQFLCDIPDETKARLDLIPSEGRPGSHSCGDSWQNGAYFSQINVNVINTMLSKGRKLVNTDFDEMIVHFTRREPILLNQHIEFIRQAISYMSFCRQTVSILTKVSNTGPNHTEAVHNESLHHLPPMALYGTAESVMV